jgi:uncharacterized membrane protein
MMMVVEPPRTHPALMSPPVRETTPKLGAGWLVMLLGTLLAVVLATLPPFVGEVLRGALYSGFAGLCHQLPERSPHIGGVMLAVCHRCYGIYLGLPLAAIVWVGLRGRSGWIGRHARALVVLSLVPLGLDWSLHVVGVWANTPASRVATGLIFGLAAGVLLARAVTTPAKRRSAENEPEPLVMRSDAHSAD